MVYLSNTCDIWLEVWSTLNRINVAKNVSSGILWFLCHLWNFFATGWLIMKSASFQYRITFFNPLNIWKWYWSSFIKGFGSLKTSGCSKFQPLGFLLSTQFKQDFLWLLESLKRSCLLVELKILCSEEFLGTWLNAKLSTEEDSPKLSTVLWNLEYVTMGNSTPATDDEYFQ